MALVLEGESLVGLAEFLVESFAFDECDEEVLVDDEYQSEDGEDEVCQVRIFGELAA